MGRHSAPSRNRGEKASSAPPATATPAETEPQPGHEQPDSGHSVSHGAPAGGREHPAHREYWGRADWVQPRVPGGRDAPPGRMAKPLVVAPDPDYIHPGLAVGRRPMPAPRPEYVAAFDDPPAAPAADELPGEGSAEQNPATQAAEPPRPAPASGRRATAGRGWTFAGVTAAAVTTVLAVLVAGQIADGGDAGKEAASTSDSKRAGEDSTGTANLAAPGGTETLSAQALHSRLSRKFPLKDDLTLSGAFITVGGSANAPGQGKLLRYRVDVERGLGLDGGLFAQLVQETLNDPRSWAHGGKRTFERVSGGPADFVITLASPGTSAVWCAKSGLDITEDNVSCDSAATQRVVINAYRWAQGAATYGGNVLAYRQMLINHEVGHRLGYDHEGCPKNGALAPVMMQQTKFLTTDGRTCKPNAWPYP